MSKGSRVVVSVVGGGPLLRGLLSKHLYFILVCFGLVIIYISLHNSVEKTMLENYRIEKEIQLLQAEYKRKTTSLLDLRQQQQVEKQLEKEGSLLHAPKNPPLWIRNGKDTRK